MGTNKNKHQKTKQNQAKQLNYLFIRFTKLKVVNLDMFAKAANLIC